MTKEELRVELIEKEIIDVNLNIIDLLPKSVPYLNDVGDVNITNPQEGQVITREGNYWINKTGVGVGDMLKSTYDIDENGIVNKAENVDDGAGNASTPADVKDAVDKKHDKHISINTQTDDYVLVLGDDYKLIDMDKATAVTLTVPKNSVVAFPIGTIIALRQKGAGQVTITPVDGTVTINSQDGLVTTAQHAMASILKVATDTWVAVGSLET